jgi:hypothetical protein
MENKPVAWMELYYGEPNNLAWTNAELKDSGDIYKTVPLYTALRKLSDDEILSLWHDWGQMITIDQQRLSFARAILKKASEK